MKLDPKHLERFERIIASATDKSLYTLIQALAEQLGQRTVAGLPVQQFFAQELDKRIEEEIADWADENMANASELRLILEKWRQGRGRILP
jgi:hypothetical protein